jgi:renalase
MQATPEQLKVAVVGAGMAGSSCAHLLALAGHTVQVFDKSRTPGGRMATRVLQWVDAQGAARLSHFDHGAAGFAAHGVGFRRFVRSAEMAGLVQSWRPVVDPAGWPLDDGAVRHVPVPDMPQLCRHLLQGTAQHGHHAVQALHRSAAGWQLMIDGGWHGDRFDAVVLALPPAQAAVLLAEHCRAWSQRASLALMQPCWTLMAVVKEPDSGAAPWQVARPTRGPLACLLRSDASPGRQHWAGQQAWVAHARPAWSREHVEQPALWVQAQLQAAVADWLGQSLSWQFTTVHRWRYAMPRAEPSKQDSQCWWNDSLRIGVCGDFLGGQGASGVEGAWLSGQVLARRMLLSEGAAAAAIDEPAMAHSRCQGSPQSVSQSKSQSHMAMWS